MVYAWIPIKDEALAYNLSISVPLGEKDDEYIDIVKKMLDAGSNDTVKTIDKETDIFEKDKIKVDWKETVVVNDCNIKNGPSNNYKVTGTLKYGDTVVLEGNYNGWYLAKTGNVNEFWIEGKNVINYDFDYSKWTFGVLTAETVTLGDISLNRGNLVYIIKRDSEKSYARPVAIDISAGYSGWINNSDYTTKKKDVYFNQAFLKKGAKVYKEASEKSGLSIDFTDFPGEWAFIDKVKADGWMYISVPGGRNGWVKKTEVYLP